MDILSALVTRLQDRFKAQIGTGELVGKCGAGPQTTLSPPAFAYSPQVLQLAIPKPPSQPPCSSLPPLNLPF